MYEETFDAYPVVSWGNIHHISNHARGKRPYHGGGFQCRHCKASVHDLAVASGVQNRNHCPYCLWSRHLDLVKSGDRLSACKAVMQPIGLTIKQSRNKYGSWHYGELMLIHRCSECGRLSINRIAADDCSGSLMEIFYASTLLDSSTREKLEESEIHLLSGADVDLVRRQLEGLSSIN